MNQHQDLPRFQSLRVISALMVREMITRYGRSWGGYFWAIAEPVGMIALLSLAFSQFLKTPPLGTSFVLFYASGYLPFAFFMTISQIASTSISANRPLMMFPMVTPLDAVIARVTLQFLTTIIVTVVILTGIGSIIEERISLELSEFMLACIAGSVLGLGIGTLNVVLFSFFPFYKNVWGIVTRPLFIVSGIFYTVESLPNSVQSLLLLNPLVHLTGESHKAFFPMYDGDFAILWYPIGLGVFTFLLGSALMLRHRSFVVENA